VGDSDLQLAYDAAPGASPPDIVNAFILGGQPGYELVSISFHSTARGTTPTRQAATLVVGEAGPEGRTPVPFSVRDGGFAAAGIDGGLDRPHQPQTEAQVERLRECLQRRRPHGDAAWTVKTARRMDLEASLRPRGRPRENLGPESSLFGEEESAG
jgi:hypothetical protein